MLTDARNRLACCLLLIMGLPLACGDDSRPGTDGGKQPGTGGAARLDGSAGGGGERGGSTTGGAPGTGGAGPTDVAPRLDSLVPDRGTDSYDGSAQDVNLATEVAVDVPSPPIDAWLNPHAIDAEPMLRVGSCQELLDWSQSIEDDATRGTGACANVTVGSLIARIRADRPDLAGIVRAPVHDGGCQTALDCPGPTNLRVLRHGDGFRLVLNRNEDFSMMSYHAMAYWYFETSASCYPEYVGHFVLTVGPPECTGSALWGYPNQFCVTTTDGGVSSLGSCGYDASTGQ